MSRTVTGRALVKWPSAGYTPPPLPPAPKLRTPDHLRWALMPCPFCGGVEPTMNYSCGSYGYYEQKASVGCECGARGPSSYGDDKKVRQEASRLWNTRRE